MSEQSDKINEAFEAWWQGWRQQNGWPNTQRMRDAGRSVYEALAYSNIDAAVAAPADAAAGLAL
jgi:hypothetical protein